MNKDNKQVEVYITDKDEEKIQQGKLLVENQTHTYNEKKNKLLKELVRGFLKTSDEKLIEDEWYKTVYYYWAYGASIGDYFIYNLNNMPHEVVKNYALLHDRVAFRRHLNKQQSVVPLLENKYETYYFLKQYYLRDIIVLQNDDDYTAFLSFVEKHPLFIVKPLDQANGRGVHVEDVTDCSQKELRLLFISLLKEGESNQTRFLQGNDSAIIIEEFIKQDERMAQFHPASVNGVRITTIRVNGEVHIYRPWLKVGINNETVMSEGRGALIAGINEKTGVVDTIGFGEKGERFNDHPQTGVTFKGFKVPEWKSLCKLAKEVSAKLPLDINYVGWDFVLSTKGWCIMEGNGNGDFLWQLVYGAGMKNEFEELIEWKQEKDYWWE